MSLTETRVVEPDSVGQAWDNENAPAGATNTTRGLTHSSDLSREGLAVQATRYPTLTPDQIARFWAKVDRTASGCWEWMAFRKPSGYGQYSAGKRRLAAHRVAYILTVGHPPADLDLDHLCRNRGCVNPDHLEPVTRRENLRRGIGHGSETHCPQDHPYTEDNIYRERDGSRKCRTCVLSRMADYHARKRRRKAEAAA